jgi:hypothetical protein
LEANSNDRNDAPDPQPGAGSLRSAMVVVDKLAKEKYRTVTQWMDFEVVE